MPEVSDAIIARAETWALHDPDADTQRELRALIGARSPELAERFCGPLAFGTAGLRGLIGGGESRMNRAVILRTTFGLARYLLEHFGDARERGVVIGYDGRRFSDVFARDAARVLAAHGIVAHMSETLCPTPIVAFAVEKLRAVAGIMVTASHNPPAYNGFKVYADNGAQIIPPADRLIADHIAAAPPADEVETVEIPDASALIRPFGAEMDRQYLDAIASLVVPRSGARSIDIVYTPLHGVGHALLRRAMEDAGFDHLHTVPEQAEPDGAFPTVDFPNPEEKGALDLALALARRHDASIIIANDPDADRLAVAVRRGAGDYEQLTGNDLGVLLGHRLIANSEGDDRLVIASLVSSPLLGAIAAAEGVAYSETLTGFKWIANKAMEREQSEHKRFIFGYEEALGYSVGTVVRDKDGISAALYLSVMAAELAAEGETLLDELGRIAHRYGLYQSAQRSLAFAGADGPAKMAALMDAIRADPPNDIAGSPVLVFTDCDASTRRARGEPPTPIDLPKSDVLIFELEGGHRVIARPSGTEPKMKIYFDVCKPLAADESLAVGRARAAARIERIGEDFCRRLA